MRKAIALLYLIAAPVCAQTDPGAVLGRLSSVPSEVERERLLRLHFPALVVADVYLAAQYLPDVIDKHWIAELSLHDACDLASVVEEESPEMAQKLVLVTGLRNPALALRERDWYKPLSFGPIAFARFVAAAPDEAERLSTGDSKQARAMRDALLASDSPIAKEVLRLAEAPSLDLPTRARAATLASQIAAGKITLEAAVKLAGSPARYFAAVADLRAQAPTTDADAYDRAMEEIALTMCRAAQESIGRAVGSDLATFRATDIYLLLAYGKSEATPPVFGAIFDRLLIPKLRAEMPKAKSLLGLLQRSGNLELRDFASAAVNAQRFDAFLQVVGSDLLSMLAGGLAEASDPVKESIRLAQVLDATSNRDLLEHMAGVIVSEHGRLTKNRSGRMLYGLLAARLLETPVADTVRAIGEPYRPYLKSSTGLALSEVFDAEGKSVQRYFFYDDEDGVSSYESFLRSYGSDSAWEIKNEGEYVHLAGRGRERRIEIFANIPINAHLPANRDRENEAHRRQQTIARVLAERKLAPKVLVHRGHSFWVERTLTYISNADRLVILGSCGGTEEIHKVLAISHDAQVIATRGVGAAEVNDPMLKALNDRLLNGAPMLEWSAFWHSQKATLGRSGLFRDYLAPDQDPGSVFLAGYYRAMDSSDPKL